VSEGPIELAVLNGAACREPPPEFFARHDHAIEAQIESVTEGLPPHSLDAEAAVLSAVFLDPAAWPKVLTLLSSDFYSEAHRQIFEACRAVAANGMPVDVVTVATELRDANRLAQVGGMPYLTEVINAAPAVSHVESYAAIVADKARRRRLVAECERAASQIRSGAHPDVIIDALVRQRNRTTTSPLRVWTPETIWAPLPAPDYLVDRVAVRGTLALLVAYGASLKTWLLADGAIAVATGTRWLHRFNTQPGRALLIDFESGDWELRRRVHRIAHGRALPLPVEGFAFVTMPTVSLVDDAFYTALEPHAKEYAFIGIDSLAAGSGGIDENDARFATSLNRLKSLAATTGCVIVVLHHSRKGSPGQREDADPREMVRGSSAIFNACDVVLQLVRRADRFLVQQTKARGGKAIESFLVRVDDTSEVASVVLASDVEDGLGPDADAGDRSFRDAKARILRLLGQEKDLRSANEIHRRIKGTKKTNLEALKELEERGMVGRVEGSYRLLSEVKT
jgi:DNA-binding transcriptional ArsR family regulator